ncbi:hypothetical protein EUTSA_v10021210mg [Eutrema salsugineum]|uniref:FHA domain-containing protein n=1 Tax=Eutrema salsugineum TaxID=72664 RepID=V4M8D2_EUTSA|nr:mitotic apparatus protein p62 [Eutrema salsugineum]ESQ48623.1 hypothetical protein EUTSA_v10021210mg [Eutrema salsugineum]
MEIEGEDGTKLSLKPGVKAVFGRGTGFNTEDLTVSRRHVSFELKPFAGGAERSESDRVCFEVLGRNPVWVRTGRPGDKIQTFRKSETGVIAAGERFCLSGHIPVWFALKRRDEAAEGRVSDGESGLDSIDISDIDPFKEFGFLVIGKEFDQYSNSRIRDIKQWEWFLEDSTNGNSDDDDDDDGDRKGRKGLSKKRRRKKGNEDDDWSVESEEDTELPVKSQSVKIPTYSTRSKKTKKDPHASSSSGSSHAQTKQRGRVDVEEDEDDETLGSFIVSDEEAKLEEEDEPNIDDDEEEEEEDFDEDED